MQVRARNPCPQFRSYSRLGYRHVRKIMMKDDLVDLQWHRLYELPLSVDMNPRELSFAMYSG